MRGIGGDNMGLIDIFYEWREEREKESRREKERIENARTPDGGG